MREFERGTNVCRNCCYHKPSKNTPELRCTHKSNVYLEHDTTYYRQAPTHKNWDWNCKNYRKSRSKAPRPADKGKQGNG